MNECFKCGVSGEKVRLHDAISNKGIVKICNICASSENFPLIKKVTEIQIAESQKKISIRDRLTGMNKSLIKKEITLRDIIDKNMKSKIQPPADLVDNFHWEIQRVKRNRKITREEFAKAIGENEATIRMIEQGFLPNNDYKIINKIENYLGINLRRPGTSGFPDTSIRIPHRRFILDNSLIEKEKREETSKKLSFNIPDSKQLKINDLKEISKKQPIDSWEEEYSQDDEQFLDEQEFDEEKF